ncbi:MAG: penicillin acylase family protein, partial [Saprospiraceae bacterium]
RYITHLQAPGWNVIGGGEPILPGVSIGHNEYGAWGLTIFDTDIEDLYVYKINPSNKNQYWHHGKWVTMKSIKDTIPVKDRKPQVVLYQYTIHGPVTFIDTLRHLAYAVRCAWLEPGCAPYLASLRMDQARNWNEFKQACRYAYIPAENMVWADKQGNIGWQAVGIAPVRNNHSGIVPVMDEIKNEWAGYLPILNRPSRFNPKEGFIATANENLIPKNYPYMNSTGYSWADPYRGARIREVLKEKNAFGILDFESLQTDYLSLPARKIVPMINELNLKDSSLETYQKALTSWNQFLNAGSGIAGLYILIERSLTEKLLKINLPENYDDRKDNDVPITYLSLDWMIRYLDSVSNKKDILLYAFKLAAKKMQSMYGVQINEWKYGDTSKFKHVYIQHALSTLASETSRQKINTQHVIRGGNGNTVGSTGDNVNQASGASFRIIVDCADWDKTVAINTPGQSGDPDSKHYKDLFDIWSKDKYFPLYFSKKNINTITDKIYMLNPVKQRHLH